MLPVWPAGLGGRRSVTSTAHEKYVNCYIIRKVYYDVWLIVGWLQHRLPHKEFTILFRVLEVKGCKSIDMRTIRDWGMFMSRINI